jgi:hypothetical protein
LGYRGGAVRLSVIFALWLDLHDHRIVVGMAREAMQAPRHQLRADRRQIGRHHQVLGWLRADAPTNDRRAREQKTYVFGSTNRCN